MFGFDLGTIKHVCIAPWVDVFSLASHYYFPRIKERYELSLQGIDVNFNQEVLYV